MDWKEYQNEFTADGDLRKIIINDVTHKDWQKIFNFLTKTEVVLNFFIDDVKSALPSQIEDVFLKDPHHYVLSLVFDDVTLNCLFDSEKDIVLNFDPGQISNEAKAKLIFRVMTTFGRRLNKTAVLIDVNREQQPIFLYQPGQGLTYLKLDKKIAPYD